MITFTNKAGETVTEFSPSIYTVTYDFSSVYSGWGVSPNVKIFYGRYTDDEPSMEVIT